MLGSGHRRGPNPAVLAARPPYGEVRLDMGSRLSIGGSG